MFDHDIKFLCLSITFFVQMSHRFSKFQVKYGKQNQEQIRLSQLKLEHQDLIYLDVSEGYYFLDSLKKEYHHLF
jgi:hypothetical protein